MEYENIEIALEEKVIEAAKKKFPDLGPEFEEFVETLLGMAFTDECDEV